MDGGNGQSSSEGQAYSKVQAAVARQVGMDDGIMVACVRVGGVYGLHASIEAQDEIVEVEA